jgi:hypothetical protein
MVSSGAKRNVIPAKAGTSHNVQVISCTFLNKKTQKKPSMSGFFSKLGMCCVEK